MFILTYTAFLLTLILITFGLVILFKNKKNLNLVTGFFCLHLLADIIWISSNGAADISKTPLFLIFWSGMAYIGACFFISFYLCFVEVFINTEKVNKLILTAYILPSVVVSFFAFSKLSIIETIFPYNQPAQIVPGVLYTWFLYYLLVSLIYATIKLTIAYQTADTQKRKQILYLKLGFISIFLGACVFDVLLPLNGHLEFYNVGPQFSLFFIILSAYAIFRHKLFDIRIIIQRSLIYTLLLIVVGGLYIFLAYTGLYFIKNSESSDIYLLDSLLVSIIGAFSIPRLERLLRKITDRWLYKDTYDYAEALHDLSEVLKQNIELDTLRQQIPIIIKKFLKSSYVELKVFSGDATELKNNDYFKIEIKLKDKLIGCLYLGAKLSGDPYRDTDTKLLRTFANQAAVALEKSRLYEEVKQYSDNLEKRVIERTLQLQQLRDNQKQMMIDISHSLQTPLTIMKGRLDNLKQDAPENEEFKVLEKTVDEISKRTYDLLRLARLESQEEKFDFHKLGLSSLMEELVEYIWVTCEAQNIILEHNIKPNVFINGDRHKLEEMINNLISNSIKYIANDRKIKVNLSIEGPNAKILVEDTGIGIDRQNLPHIFERFYRGSNSGHSKTGMGVGLAISKKIAEKHGGNIKVESILGSGTTLLVNIPLYY